MRKGGLGALERLPPIYLLSILSNIIDKPTKISKTINSHFLNTCADINAEAFIRKLFNFISFDFRIQLKH